MTAAKSAAAHPSVMCERMIELRDICVTMIEGSVCMVEVKAKKVAAGQYEITECPEFDAEDTSLLLEYLPGDVVQVERDTAIALLSTQQTEERAYWRFLFEVTDKGAPVLMNTTSPHFEAVVSRIREEIKQGSRWHYPAVRDWIARNTQG